MEKILAIIEKGNDGGYSIHAANDVPLFSNGLTEDEARRDFEILIPEQAEYIRKKTGSYPSWYDGGFEVEYRYDLSAFFLAFPFINATQLARSLGINPSLMRKYKSGIAKASKGQKDQIQHKFEDIVSRLETVRF